MSFLGSALAYTSPGITAATQVAGGYAQGQERARNEQLSQALLAIKQKRQDEQDKIMNALHAAQTRSANATADQGPAVTYQTNADGEIVALPTHLPNAGEGPTRPVAAPSSSPAVSGAEGAPSGPAASPGPNVAPVASPASPATSPSPTIGVKTGVRGVDPVARAVQIAKATKGIPSYGDLHPRDSYSATPGMDPVTGKPTVYTLNTKTGQMASTGIGKPGTGAGAVGALAAPMAAKVGQFGEMLKKASDLMPATDALNVSLGSSASQDVATHGIGVGPLHIPGTQGLGSMMVNRSPEYATYQAALSPFILAAAHALSGARINDTQVQQIRASIEIKPGDSPQVRAQKHKNVIDLINSIGGSLPSDAIAAQEDQMEPNSIALLKGYGYRPAPRNAPKTGGSSGDINLGGKPKLTQAQYNAGIAKGHTPAEIAQHYDLSQVKQ